MNVATHAVIHFAIYLALAAGIWHARADLSPDDAAALATALILYHGASDTRRLVLARSKS